MKSDKSIKYKENTIKFFNQMAHKSHGDSFKHYNNVLKWLKELSINEKYTLLDLGTGKGDLLVKILNNISIKNKSWNLIGLDISPEMIKKALEKKLPVNLNVGDSESLPYKNLSIDIITCINSFHHYSNPEKSIYEINRVLKSEGILILGEIWLPPIFRNLINLFLPYMKTGDYKIYSCKDIIKLFSQQGIILVEKKYVFPSNYTYLFKKK
ncbi:class I SAM-dependent methyltransferase [Cetobacterium sp.]|uniref:class I SAM-dependent methyltransferase n=1 Tax=Cetobacterium sp. TaxID=2071632 RepID=UPI00262053B5|nr:class I SAM-dependent methyltransferase [uncultured Cetobacterium sp.]